MGVDAAAVTSAEAAQYRAAGWWTDITLSGCVAHNAASTPDKPAYVEFSLDAPDCALTWSEFDHAATNLAHRAAQVGCRTRRRRRGLAQGHPRPFTCCWSPSNAAEQSTVGLGARAGVREVAAILRTTRPTLVVSDADRLDRSSQAAEDADPSLRVVGLGRRLAIDTDVADRTRKQPLARRGRRRLPDQLHFGHHRTTEMRCPQPESVALLPSEGGCQRRAHRRRRVSSRHPDPFGFGIWTSHTTPIHLGATTVRIERFDAAATCAAIERHRATVLCCVSTQLAMILADSASREYDLTACGWSSPAANRCPTRRRPSSRS